jgi:hypothetical protein
MLVNVCSGGFCEVSSVVHPLTVQHFYRLTANLGSAEFQPITCMEKYAMEKLTDIKTALLDEAEFFDECVAKSAICEYTVDSPTRNMS